jgi:tRNA threonylcarbamoyladenosine biosynthesis protein TsaB
LAIESATRRAGVALLREGEVVAALASDDGDHHAERLLPMIDELLAGAGVSLAGVDAFAVSIGPGGFTSLRIGLATLKGLAFDTDVPVAAISTLEAMSHAALAAGLAGANETIVASLDARRGDLYAGGYRATGDARLLECVIPDFVCRPAELAARLEGRVRVVGEGAGLFGPEIARLATRAEVAVDTGSAVWPTAASVGALGRARLAEGLCTSAGALVPRYLRRAQAEETRLAQRAE